MTCTEFLESMKIRGAKIAPGTQPTDIAKINMGLQSIKAAILPKSMTDFYTESGGIILDCGYIFGPHEITNGANAPVPSILDINRDVRDLAGTVGKTIFGRNDLFWFAFDAFGNFYMLDNVSLRILRKYDDPYRAITDCLFGGKF